MDQKARCMHFMATCPHCGHHALGVGEIRTVDAGVDISMICRTCGGAAVLRVAETLHTGDDELASFTTMTGQSEPDSRKPEQSRMLSKLDEALEHSRNVGTCLETFIDPNGFAHVAPAHAMQVLAIASSLVDNLDEALATSRDAIRSGW